MSEKVGHIVFCPRKTASASISRSWAKCSKKPSFHTHDLKHFVITDVKMSIYYEFISSQFDILHLNDLDKELEEYTIISDDLTKLFSFFDKFIVISTVRDPKIRRISELFQILSIEEINAVMDTLGIDEQKRINVHRKPRVSELCNVFDQIKDGLAEISPVLYEGLSYISTSRKLLNYSQVEQLFKTYFVEKEMTEYTLFFDKMFMKMSIDFDLEKVNSDGYQVIYSEFLGKPTTQLLIKLETVVNKSSGILEQLTGIRTLRKDHDARNSHHIFQASQETMKHYIRQQFVGNVLVDPNSAEGQISSTLGYM